MTRKAQQIIIPIIVLACITAMLLLTDPTRLPSLFLILPFVLLFFALYWMAAAFFDVIGPSRESGSGIKIRKSRLLAALIAILPVWLLVLQSIGQLTLSDAVVTIMLFIFAYVYIIKSTNAHS